MGLLNPLSTKFTQNSLIIRFGELKYFSNVKSTGTGYTSPFNCCYNLEYVNTDNFINVEGNTANVGTNGSPFQRTKIVNLYLPNLVSVGQYAFKCWSTLSADAGKSSLRIVVIGKNFTTVSNRYAFNYSEKVDFFIYAKTPATGSVLERGGYNLKNIYVPDDVLDNYKAAPAFEKWVSYIKPLSEYNGEKPWEELYPEELGLV